MLTLLTWRVALPSYKEIVERRFIPPPACYVPPMQWTIILEATTGWGERTCTPAYALSRPLLDLKPEQIGLTLAEAKTLLARLQERLIGQQANEYALIRRVCPCCRRMQPAKDYKCRQRTSRP